VQCQAEWTMRQRWMLPPAQRCASDARETNGRWPGVSPKIPRAAWGHH
jgi:hypothetical protein